MGAADRGGASAPARVLVLLGAFPVVAAVLGWLGSLGWLFDLFSHFRAQYAAALLLSAVGLLLVRGYRAALVFGALAAVETATLAPYLLPRPAPAVGAERTLRIATVNVNTANPHAARVRAFVERADPDVLLLVETDDRWLADLAPLAGRYPHRIVHPRADNFGIALFSRLPCPTCRVVALGGEGLPSVAGELLLSGGRTLTLVGTHPLPPVGGRGTAARDRQLADVARYLAAREGPRVLAGDLNATPWSAPFRELVERTGLRDAARGHGLRPTWPARPWWLRIPIDHVLVSPELEVVGREVGPDVGSDHLPVVVEVAL